MPYDITAAVGAAAFWGFVAVCVIAGVASSVIRNRETQKTIRQAIERGQTLDPATLERLMHGATPAGQTPAQARFGFIAGGIIMLCIGAGLAVMGWFISLQSHDAFYPMLGVGSLVGLIGVGLLIASVFAGKGDGAGRG
jgi:hypothetical protein